MRRHARLGMALNPAGATACSRLQEKCFKHTHGENVWSSFLLSKVFSVGSNDIISVQLPPDVAYISEFARCKPHRPLFNQKPTIQVVIQCLSPITTTKDTPIPRNMSYSNSRHSESSGLPTSSTSSRKKTHARTAAKTQSPDKIKFMNPYPIASLTAAQT